MLGNLIRSFAYFGLASLIGYYNFELNGGIGLATNVCFFFLGFLLVSTWKSPEHVCPECPEPEFEPYAVKEEPVEEEPVDETSSS
jgi:hypothetical protein